MLNESYAKKNTEETHILSIPVDSRQQSIEYLAREDLLKYIEVDEQKQYGIFDSVDKDYTTPYKPEVEDLCRLHRLIRSRKVFTVLEFGIGYSTLVMADALKKNKADFYADAKRPNIRIKEPFKIYSVDASERWIKHFKSKYGMADTNSVLDFEFRDFIELLYSPCTIGEFNGQICHYYNEIPNVVPDFIYLDAPSANDVDGSIKGIRFSDCVERTVMSGDLLKLEPMLLPGTLVLVDGRTNNARFLKNNFKRNFTYEWSEEQDVSAFELCEPPLGKINRDQIDYCLGEDFYSKIQE